MNLNKCRSFPSCEQNRKELHNSRSAIKNTNYEFLYETSMKYLQLTMIKKNYNGSSDSENNSNQIEKESNHLSKFWAQSYNMAYKIINTESKLLKLVMHSHGLKEEEHNDFNILWTGCSVRPHVLSHLDSFQRVNHFPRSAELTRKDRLCLNIQYMQHQYGSRNYDIIPETFILPMDLLSLTSSMMKHKGPWIVKPFALSRGRGIFLISKITEIHCENYIVSKYIQNPLLIEGRKCDLRLYVVVTCFDPLVIYLYEEGLVRVASVPYDMKGGKLWNTCMHLTNYSINKYHYDYVKANDSTIEDYGNKWTFSALLRQLRSSGHDISKLIEQIESMIIKTLISVQSTIAAAVHMFVPHRRNCFELFGFDILIDATLKPWLIEVNLSPSLGCDTSLDLKIKSTLLTDLLTLVGIPIVSPKQNKRHKLSHDNSTRHSRMERSSYRRIKHDVLQYVQDFLEENKRKRGFLCIFPTCQSWTIYGQYFNTQKDINKSFHSILFSSTRELINVPTLEYRIQCYERSLPTLNSVYSQFSFSSIDDIERDSICCIDEQNSVFEIKELFDNGYLLSHLQSRQAFSRYLQLIYNRLIASHSINDMRQMNILVRFLNTALNNKSLSFQNQRIYGDKQNVILIEQLEQYMQKYNDETKLLENKCLDNLTIYIPEELFQSFLQNASEMDIEEVLLHFMQLNSGAHLFLH